MRAKSFVRFYISWLFYTSEFRIHIDTIHMWIPLFLHWVFEWSSWREINWTGRINEKVWYGISRQRLWWRTFCELGCCQKLLVCKVLEWRVGPRISQEWERTEKIGKIWVNGYPSRSLQDQKKIGFALTTTINWPQLIFWIFLCDRWDRNQWLLN